MPTQLSHTIYWNFGIHQAIKNMFFSRLFMLRGSLAALIASTRNFPMEFFPNQHWSTISGSLCYVCCSLQERTVTLEFWLFLVGDWRNVCRELLDNDDYFWLVLWGKMLSGDRRHVLEPRSALQTRIPLPVSGLKFKPTSPHLNFRDSS